MFANALTGLACVTYNEATTKRGILMADVSVYYFMRHGGPGGKALLSKRRATLETIKARGEAVMQSRRVVDHTEVDGNGFLIGGAGDESHPEIWSQIRSLESRAKSRDAEALKIVEGTASGRRQMLHEESLELRNQARILKSRVDRIKADKLRNEDSPQRSIGYWPPRTQFG
jgi:hypothetical protein